jgi:hypothetical protein
MQTCSASLWLTQVICFILFQSLKSYNFNLQLQIFKLHNSQNLSVTFDEFINKNYLNQLKYANMKLYKANCMAYFESKSICSTLIIPDQ